MMTDRHARWRRVGQRARAQQRLIQHARAQHRGGRLRIDIDAEDALIKDLIQGRATGSCEKKFLFDIVSNQRNSVDVDKFDYISRDAYVVRCARRRRRHHGRHALSHPRCAPGGDQDRLRRAAPDGVQPRHQQRNLLPGEGRARSRGGRSIARGRTHTPAPPPYAMCRWPCTCTRCSTRATRSTARCTPIARAPRSSGCWSTPSWPRIPTSTSGCRDGRLRACSVRTPLTVVAPRCWSRVHGSEKVDDPAEVRIACSHPRDRAGRTAHHARFPFQFISSRTALCATSAVEGAPGRVDPRPRLPARTVQVRARLRDAALSMHTQPNRMRPRAQTGRRADGAHGQGGAPGGGRDARGDRCSRERRARDVQGAHPSSLRGLARVSTSERPTRRRGRSRTSSSIGDDQLRRLEGRRRPGLDAHALLLRYEDGGRARRRPTAFAAT